MQFKSLLATSLLIACTSLGLLSACKPDITSNTYYCGPEGLCPPDLACQMGDPESFAYNCVSPFSVTDFACPEITVDREPDNTTAEAYELGTLACGDQLAFTNWGCIPEGSDVDHFRVQTEGVCAGSNPRFKASLRFPIGSAPVHIELLDSEDAPLAASSLCTSEVDTTGTESTCLEVPNLPPGEYYLRVSIDPAGNADCDGACRFNRYQIFASSPVI